MVAKGACELERAAQVVLVVLDGLVHRLAHRLVRGEVNGTADGLLVEDAVEKRPVLHVALVEGTNLLARDALDALEGDLAGVGQVVDHDDVIASVEQLNAGVAADEAGTARDKDARLFGLSYRIGHTCSFLNQIRFLVQPLGP